MGPELFARLLHDIMDPETRHNEFMKGLDAVGENGPFALQKLNAMMRLMAHGVSFDVVEEYTSVGKAVARKALYGFCDRLDV